MAVLLTSKFVKVCRDVFFLTASFVVLSESSYAQCQYTLPNGTSVPLDLEHIGTLGFTKEIRVINLYWGGNNWDGIPAHKPADAVHYGFQKKDIDNATRALFSTDYFDKLCQYGRPSGGPRVKFIASTDTGQALNPCLPHAPLEHFYYR